MTHSPITFDFLPWWGVLALWIGVAGPILWLGLRSLSSLGPVRQWVAIGTRIALLLCLVLIIGGARWKRWHKNVDVIVTEDLSQSATDLAAPPGVPLENAVDQYLRAASDQSLKKPMDRIGIVAFADDAWIDSPLTTQLDTHMKPIHALSTGTDIGSAIELGLAMFDNTARRRMVLISDGNANLGELEPAIAEAAAQHVPIDVMPLHYQVGHEVMVDRVVAPSWKREGDPFTVETYLTSVNPGPVTGKLTLLMDGTPILLDPKHPEQTYADVTLQPGRNRYAVSVPGLRGAGAHRFTATFEGSTEGPDRSDTLLSNNTAQAFTFVQGEGQILYVDNVPGGSGDLLSQAVAEQGLKMQRITAGQFPTELIDLQRYDAIVMANVPLGYGGLTREQDAMIAHYVHDIGGGLVMIGGPDTLGAGGWHGSKTEEVLPVDLSVPAQRQIPKGALVLVMDPCEMPEGTYWGEQCGLAAIQSLSSGDDIGIITYTANASDHHWDLPLTPKGDGSKARQVLKNVIEDDMPNLDLAVTLALDGPPGHEGLIADEARVKHIIIISDGDPAPVSPATIARCKDHKITVSTITAFPHMQGDLPKEMKDVAEQTGGKFYGPIETEPNRLPQIFIKESTIVHRSLIQESTSGFPVFITDGSSDLVHGLPALPDVHGLVLTSRKHNPVNDIKIALSVRSATADGKPTNDPLLAQWQSGLGRSVVFASDAHNRWASSWVGSGTFGKFWSQVIRSVARPPMSTDVQLLTTQDGARGHVSMVSSKHQGDFLNFLSVQGKEVGPDQQTHDMTLVQTGPGTYEADFDARSPGTHVVLLSYASPTGARGTAVSGLAVNDNPEFRDLSSNDSMLDQIAKRTGGRMLQPFDSTTADLFTREGLAESSSSMPVWDLLLPIAMALLLVDVAVRRIAWDWAATKRLMASAANKVREFTSLRKVEAATTMSALQQTRAAVADRMEAERSRKVQPIAAPDPTAKFNAGPGVEGDLSALVGGASEDATAGSAHKSQDPQEEMANRLREAKRRARDRISKQSE